MTKAFQAGQVVTAKVRIWNRKGTVLEPGDTATIRDRYPHDSTVPATIVSVILANGRFLIDITRPHDAFE